MDLNPPKIYIVDDEASFRKSLARLLKAHRLETEMFENASQFLNAGLSGRSGCIVLDVHMPGLNGLEMQEALSHAGCTMPIIFLTGRGSIPLSVRAMKAGAADFLTKPIDENDLLSAIGKALKENQKRNEARAHKNEIRQRMLLLSDREFEVMTHIITGELNKQIGARLNIAEKTVKVHRGRVMQKMGVVSVAELVRLCDVAGIEPASDKT